MAYVYRHIRLDKNEPFYIGIGKNIYRHSSRWGRNELWHKIVSKTKYEVEIILEDISWEEACIKEKEFIALYGRINKLTGILANMTDGGDGNIGMVFTDEIRAKIGAASKGRIGYWKGKKIPPEVTKRVADAQRGRANFKLRGKIPSEKSREAVRKHSIGNKYSLGHKHTEETRKKISDKCLGRPSPNKGKPGMSGSLNGMFGKKQSEEAIKKMSEAQILKPVLQFSLSGEFLNEYKSITAAALSNKVFATGIQASCKNRFPHYKKYIWRYKDQ